MHIVRSQGFTLVELMVTVVILAIIVGIAYPSYRNYTIQTRRSDAQIGLTRVANLQEKFFSACNRYTTTMVGGGIAACSGLGYVDNDSPEDHYQITVAGGTIAGVGNINTAFTATAAPKAGGLQVGNGNLRIDSTGRKEWNKPGTGWVSWTAK